MCVLKFCTGIFYSPFHKPAANWKYYYWHKCINCILQYWLSLFTVLSLVAFVCLLMHTSPLQQSVCKYNKGMLYSVLLYRSCISGVSALEQPAADCHAVDRCRSDHVPTVLSMSMQLVRGSVYFTVLLRRVQAARPVVRGTRWTHSAKPPATQLCVWHRWLHRRVARPALRPTPITPLLRAHLGAAQLEGDAIQVTQDCRGHAAVVVGDNVQRLHVVSAPSAATVCWVLWVVRDVSGERGGSVDAVRLVVALAAGAGSVTAPAGAEAGRLLRSAARWPGCCRRAAAVCSTTSPTDASCVCVQWSRPSTLPSPFPVPSAPRCGPVPWFLSGSHGLAAADVPRGSGPAQPRSARSDADQSRRRRHHTLYLWHAAARDTGPTTSQRI